MRFCEIIFSGAILFGMMNGERFPAITVHGGDVMSIVTSTTFCVSYRLLQYHLSEHAHRLQTMKLCIL